MYSDIFYYLTKRAISLTYISVSETTNASGVTSAAALWNSSLCKEKSQQQDLYTIQVHQGFFFFPPLSRLAGCLSLNFRKFTHSRCHHKLGH